MKTNTELIGEFIDTDGTLMQVLYNLDANICELLIIEGTTAVSFFIDVTDEFDEIIKVFKKAKNKLKRGCTE